MTANEDSAEAFNMHSYQHLLDGTAGKALNCFQRALALAPDNPVVLNNLGNALQNLDRLDGARQVYRQAIDVAPDYPRPYRNLALLHQLQGRPDKAIAAYHRYLDRARMARRTTTWDCFT